MKYQEILYKGSQILRNSNIKTSNLDCELILSKVLNKSREFLPFEILYWGAILCNVIFVFGIFGIIYFPEKMYPNQGEKGTEE